MRNRITSILLFITLLSGMLITIQDAAVPHVYAGTESVATMDQFQSKLSAALNGRAAAFSLTYSGGALTIPNLEAALNKVLNADDYLQYVLKSASYTASATGSITTVNYIFSYWETLEQTRAVSAKVTEVLGQIITGGMNNDQKERAIHDWIVLHLSYDTTLTQHSAYAGIVAPFQTVCQGYALLAYKMLNQAGIPSRIVEGTAGGQLHTWVEVQLNGAWYHMDPTWDDPVPDVQGRISYDYYNLTDTQIKSDHSWKKTYPAATTMYDVTLRNLSTTSTTNSQFYQEMKQLLGLQFLTSDFSANNREELYTKLLAASKNRQTEVKVRYVNGASAASDLKAVMSQLTNVSSYSYTKTNYVRTVLPEDVILSLRVEYSGPATDVTLSVKPAVLSLKVGGETGKLTAANSNGAAGSAVVQWTTSNAAIATVSTAGVVKAISKGTATITAKSVSGKTAEAVVTVTSSESGGTVKNVALDKNSLNLKSGQADVKLTATVTPADGGNALVLWTSSNTNVATVSTNGLVHAVAAGAAVITAKNADGSRKATCIVTVSVKVTGIAIVGDQQVKVGKQIVLSAKITPSNAGAKVITWSTNNKSIGTVSSTGTLTGKSAGTVKVTATVEGGITATVSIKVLAK